MTTDEIAPFETLYRDSRDPWGTAWRWYERRKRALLLAALSDERYESAYEAGCGTGHVSAELAGRCTRLLASDASDAALDIARDTLRGRGNVSIERHRLPDDWPRRAFDLVVLGEIVYFLSADARARIADDARTSAGREGLVVACDWRAPIDGHGVSGHDAHRDFERTLGLPRRFEYLDDDFVLTGWSADTRSVAVREGLR